MLQAITTKPMKETDPYQARFAERHERGETASEPAWLYPLRKLGMNRFSELGFPTVEHEDWRFTNVAPVVRLPFRPVLGGAEDVTLEWIKGRHFTAIHSHLLVFVNGLFAPELSTLLPTPDGVKIKSLAAAIREDGALVQSHLGHYTRGDDNGFAALNTAFFADGGFLHIPAGVEVREPVHLLFVNSAEESGSTVHPRNLVVLEAGAKVTLIESYVSAHEAATVTSPVNEFMVGENASLEHCKFQEESRSAYHLATQHFYIGRSANVVSHSIALGAKLSRTNIRTSLNGEGIECVLNGVYVGKDDQLLDHHMIVEHASPHCASHEYFNGILDDRSKGVFHGRILVRQEAQKTDAKQTNKNLLLTDNATANTKPQLEIYADDVKCTHGATIGQLDDESIFYLRSRGISTSTARRILIHAFAGEITERVRCQAVREELDNLLWNRLEQNPHIADK